MTQIKGLFDIFIKCVFARKLVMTGAGKVGTECAKETSKTNYTNDLLMYF
ncbi:hypothetical protein FIV04_15530 (plasmid) [Vibrio sp. THAF190c]|nr:hypothetical protein FIV04_15530 [Vibrio sp. THAF190c]